MIENRGEMSFEDADDANVPVDIWANQITEESLGDGYDDMITEEDFGKWQIHADNYMPRKSRLGGDGGAVFFAVADTKEEIAEIVQKHILPLYQNAMFQLNKMIETGTGSLYYWD